MAEVSNSNLLSTDTGIPGIEGACVVIVRTEWNATTVGALEAGCKAVLEKAGVNYRVITVPGAFEIPYGIRAYWDIHKYRDDRPQAFIALGCVLRGDTPHFEYVCRAVTDGVLQLNLTLPIPTIFGVLTVDNQQQADERIGGKHGHKGEEAAITALKMIAVKKTFQ
ncbi:6,7-dimethyl-8-ribityllumazine synthase [Puia dinghuensis]|uniref:6,7-dimethyl-8-ribityllumazine synthase n=1 Tax=Puia dinghuensis TaxID=1792502 RepID=A0A8J2U757_9BACT|nr:6,7-dimethyl-8-ribityllumazine synthase [Puia dinghuensis]GGA83552.1 6,7-dimethyl-8-ribityllumazine synthase [Puia dinghuensis]